MGEKNSGTFSVAGFVQIRPKGNSWREIRYRTCSLHQRCPPASPCLLMRSVRTIPAWDCTSSTRPLDRFMTTPSIISIWARPTLETRLSGRSCTILLTTTILTTCLPRPSAISRSHSSKRVAPTCFSSKDITANK